MPTTAALEMVEQRRWRVHPGQPPATWADDLLRDEFLDESKQRDRARKALAEALRFAGEAVPYYQRLFRRAKVRDFDAPDVLARIPTLTRAELQANAAILRNPGLPEAERDTPTRTSGTTGQPTEVAQSVRSMGMFARLKQRELRWFRFDPAGKMCTIRPSPEFPPMKDGRWLGERQILRVPGWPWIGHLFQTGEFAGFSNTNTVEDQIEFVRTEVPEYLVMQAAGLEHFAFASQGLPRPPLLKACLSISQTLTPAMRATVETTLGVPVHQNYGFNEVGIVATRCPEGGRYHVHLEHCVVEIVDPDGRPCRPGDQGRVLVTCLTNRAMPLVRYDPDDFATAVEGPCPCGRTLPSFGEILGRYRRIALLPQGAWQRWASIQRAIHELPPELKGRLRRYQAHQYADGSWVLRIAATGPVEPIAALIAPRFAAALPGDAPPLRVVASEEFEGKPHGKFQDFLSDFVPAPDARGA